MDGLNQVGITNTPLNYLSHFYIDHQPDQHYYNTGLILPDLAKSQVKQFRLPLLQPGDVMNQLQQGCLRHYLRDKQFHASEWFGQLNHQINEAVKEAGFSDQLQRKWFLAHVLTELMIDRIIVKEYPEVNDMFYDSLRKVDMNTLRSFLDIFGATDVPLFLNRFEHFRQVAFVGYYPDTNKFVYSLTRIMMRVGLPEMSGSDQQLLGGLCDELETRLFHDRREMINQLRKNFDA